MMKPSKKWIDELITKPEKGNPKNVFYTTDEYSSGVTAQNNLSLPATPTHRIMIEPSQVSATYGGNVAPAYNMPGGGTELITSQPIKINPSSIEILGK